MTKGECNDETTLVQSSGVWVCASWAEAEYAKGKLSLNPEQLERLLSDECLKMDQSQLAPMDRPKRERPAIEWIEPLEAVQMLAPKVGGDAAAKAAIAERLKDGIVECCTVWLALGPDIGAISSQRPKFPMRSEGVNSPPWISPIAKPGTPTMLGPAFWQFSDDWGYDHKRWNWAAGLFVVGETSRGPVVQLDGIPIRQLKSEGRTRMVASGVRFSKADIEKIAPPNPLQTTTAPIPLKEAGDNGSASKAWPLWVAEMVLFQHEVGIPGAMKVTDLMKAVEKRLVKDGHPLPSKSRAYEAASVILKTLRKRGNLI
jgi:hypothetical protein